MSKKSITSGAITDAISTMLGGLTVAFDKMTKNGIELGKITEQDNIFTVPFKIKDGTKFIIKYKYQNEEHTLMKIMIKDSQGNEVKRQRVIINTPEDYTKTIYDMLDEGWDITPEEVGGTPDQGTADDSTNPGTDMVVYNSAKKLNVTLQRVCSATEDSINLVRVYGNYSEKDMQSDIETLLDNEDMLSQITEEPVSFEVTDDGDELDVNPVEMSETECISVSLTNILSCAFKTLHNLQAIHWNAKGDKFEEIHRGSDSCIWNVRSQIDTLAELCVELTGSVSHPALLCSTDSSLNTQSGFEGQEALQMIHSDMSEYIYCLEFYLPNFKDDVQNMMNMWIRDMRHMMDYQLGRSVDTNIAPVLALI